MNIKKLIKNEIDYFEPILKRQANASIKERKLWRKETISERKIRISLEIYDMYAGTISYGPFKNLILDRDPWWGKEDLGGLILGVYEKEVLKIIEKIKPGDYERFIDIGAADGYYACGLLFSGKIKRAICFEKSLVGQKTIKKNWIKNGSPGHLTIHSEANETTIKKISGMGDRKTLILIDIEGGEFELLSSLFIKNIAKSTIIIEVHNWVDNFLDKYVQLIHRLSKYFDIEPIKAIDRQVNSIKTLREFTDDNRLLLASERRPCLMRFLILTPKNLNGAQISKH